MAAAPLAYWAKSATALTGRAALGVASGTFQAAKFGAAFGGKAVKVAAPVVFEAAKTGVDLGSRSVAAGAGVALTTAKVGVNIGAKAATIGSNAALGAAKVGGETIRIAAPAALSVAKAGADIGAKTATFGFSAALGAAKLGGETIRIAAPAALSVAKAGADIGAKTAAIGFNAALGAAKLGEETIRIAAPAALSVAKAGADIGGKAVSAGASAAVSTARAGAQASPPLLSATRLSVDVTTRSLLSGTYGMFNAIKSETEGSATERITSSKKSADKSKREKLSEQERRNGAERSDFFDREEPKSDTNGGTLWSKFATNVGKTYAAVTTTAISAGESFADLAARGGARVAQQGRSTAATATQSVSFGADKIRTVFADRIVPVGTQFAAYSAQAGVGAATQILRYTQRATRFVKQTTIATLRFETPPVTIDPPLVPPVTPTEQRWWTKALENTRDSTSTAIQRARALSDKWWSGATATPEAATVLQTAENASGTEVNSIVDPNRGSPEIRETLYWVAQRLGPVAIRWAVAGGGALALGSTGWGLAVPWAPFVVNEVADMSVRWVRNIQRNEPLSPLNFARDLIEDKLLGAVAKKLNKGAAASQAQLRKAAEKK